MSVVLAVYIFLFPVLGLAFYVAYRCKPSRFKVSASVLKVFNFSIEIEAQEPWEHRDGPSALRRPSRRPRRYL